MRVMMLNMAQLQAQNGSVPYEDGFDGYGGQGQGGCDGFRDGDAF